MKGDHAMTIMTTTDTAPARPGRVRSALAGTARRILATYRLGGRAIVAAPLLVALAILPELAQHVVEIKLGMFTSKEAFRGLANDPLRWHFGYVKLAGFWLAIMGIARFWAVGGDWRELVRPGWPMTARIALGIGLAVAQSVTFTWAKAHGAAPFAPALDLVSLLIQTALSVYLVGALLGDRDASLRWSFGAGIPRALFMTLLLVLAFGPCQLLHMANHRLAIGAPLPLVWLAMLWDGLFIGLFAALVGSAGFVGYRYGPGWRGWERPLED